MTTHPNQPVAGARLAALVLDVATLKRRVDELAAAPAGAAGEDTSTVGLLRSEVSGLGEQVDALTGQLGGLVDNTARLDQLAAALDQLGTAVEALYAEEEDGRRSWFELEPDTAAEALAVLDPWVRTILARHGKVLERLRPCWWQHPLVVEELLILAALWHTAYRGRRAAWDKAAAWHERHLPDWLDRCLDRREFSGCETEHTMPAPVVARGWAPLAEDVVTRQAETWTATRADWPPPPPALRTRPVPAQLRVTA